MEVTITISTVLRIHNLSKSDIVSIFVYDVDRFDWGDLNPYIFNNEVIPAGDVIEHLLEVNAIAANCPLSLVFTFKSGEEDVIKMNHKYAIGRAPANFAHTKKAHRITYEQTGKNVITITIRDMDNEE
ncbi:hypothetical protein BDFB_006199 [Asbolus verrucosus]|uniref:Uncharacterized protein n=1 Tax=Asbolus verrucosus TaxID=1661398 RepID=A0A482WAY3_ASBVE|nr:hypothetical protein BDFB_006199 [Asbolus verrucosus]